MNKRNMRRSIVFQQQYYADGGMWTETRAQQHGYAFHEESSWSSDKRFPAMPMNKLDAFAVDSDLSMSKKHAKLGARHMNNRLADFALDSEISMPKQKQDKLGGGMMHMNMLGVCDFAMDSELSMTLQKHGQLGAMHMNKLGAFGTDSHILMSKQHVKLGGSSGNMFQEGMHSDHGFGRGYAHHGSCKRSPFGANKASRNFSKGGGGGKFNSGGHHDYFSEETEYEKAYAEEHVGAITAEVEEMRYQHHNWGGDTCYVNPYDRNKNW